MFRSALALAACSAFFAPPTSAQHQDVRDPSARERWILMLRDTQPSLDLLRTAIRAGRGEEAERLAAQLKVEARTTRAALDRAVEDLGGRIVEHFWLVDGCVVEIPADASRTLGELPHVVRGWHDGPRAPGDFAPIKTSTNGDNHNTDQVQLRGVRGSGVTVAVVDSGLDSQMAGLNRPHSTFFVNGDPNNTTGGGIAGSRLLANVQVGAFPADDLIDHGTRVAGVAIGARWNALPGSDHGHAPAANVVGYSLVDGLNGATVLATMVRAWQRCAIDAARHGTKVAVISYEGTLDPLSPEQQAMDACAELADLVITAMAGNDPGNQTLYQGATNVLAVGAVQHDTHAVASFTATGPLQSPGLAPRVYPHLVANGDLMVMPSADREASSVQRSGTSYSAPGVAGAAALFRSVATTASAESTRAAILATLDDLRSRNPNDLDRIGHGYLRVDQLIDLAQGRIGGVVTDGTVDVTTPGWSTTVAATAGQVYAAALAFSRRDPGTLAFSDLDLRITQNGVTLAESRRTADTHERVTFRAIATGPVTVEVAARRFEVGRVAQEFGIAVAAVPLPLVQSFGGGCPSARTIANLRQVEPFTQTGSFGNAASDVLLGGTPHRTQQWIATDSLHAAFNVVGLAFRHDDAPSSGPWPSAWVELDATLDLTLAAPSAMSSNFAQNLGRLATQVIARKRFVLPAMPAPNTQPSNFAVLLPLDQRFDRLYDPLGPTGGGGAQDLILDVRTWATSAGARPLRYPLDAVTGLPAAATLTAPSPTATVGTLMAGTATVVGLVDAMGGGLIPQLTASGLPVVGSAYRIDLAAAPPSTPSWLTFGISRTAFGSLPLPLDLAAVGAPGCFLLADVQATVQQQTDLTGAASFTIPVPTLPGLWGVGIYHQALVSDPLANQLGLITTGAIEAVIGR